MTMTSTPSYSTLQKVFTFRKAHSSAKTRFQPTNGFVKLKTPESVLQAVNLCRETQDNGHSSCFLVLNDSSVFCEVMTDEGYSFAYIDASGASMLTSNTEDTWNETMMLAFLLHYAEMEEADRENGDDDSYELHNAVSDLLFDEDDDIILKATVAGNNLYYRLKDGTIPLPTVTLESECSMTFNKSDVLKKVGTVQKASFNNDGVSGFGPIAGSALNGAFRLPHISVEYNAENGRWERVVDTSRTFEVPETLKPMIPILTDETYVSDRMLKIARRIHRDICKGIPTNLAVYGPSATGKSEFFRILGGLFQLPVMTLECGANTTESWLTNEFVPNPSYKAVQADGSVDEREFITKDSPLMLGVRYGGFVELQEVNFVVQSGVLGTLNSLANSRIMSDINGNTIRANPLFVLGISFNPGYTATQDLPESFLNRFTAYEFGLLSQEDMVKMAVGHTTIPEGTVNEMARVLCEIRSLAAKEEITLVSPVSLRNLLAWCNAAEEDDAEYADFCANIDLTFGAESAEERINRGFYASVLDVISHDAEDKRALLEVFKASPLYRHIKI